MFDWCATATGTATKLGAAIAPRGRMLLGTMLAIITDMDALTVTITVRVIDMVAQA